MKYRTLRNKIYQSRNVLAMGLASGAMLPVLAFASEPEPTPTSMQRAITALTDGLGDAVEGIIDAIVGIIPVVVPVFAIMLAIGIGIKLVKKLTKSGN